MCLKSALVYNSLLLQVLSALAVLLLQQLRVFSYKRGSSAVLGIAGS